VKWRYLVLALRDHAIKQRQVLLQVADCSRRLPHRLKTFAHCSLAGFDYSRRLAFLPLVDRI
jgi:hypothetical protein